MHLPSTAAALSIFALPFIPWAGAQPTQRSLQTPEVAVFVDPRDGNVYRTVQLGSQIWLGENIRFETEDSWVYEREAANAARFGRLYDWEGALGACPPGWRLPTTSEWTQLFNQVGGLVTAGGNLKEAGTKHWTEPNTGATNVSQFGGLPGGARRN